MNTKIKQHLHISKKTYNPRSIDIAEEMVWKPLRSIEVIASRSDRNDFENEIRARQTKKKFICSRGTDPISVQFVEPRGQSSGGWRENEDGCGEILVMMTFRMCLQGFVLLPPLSRISNEDNYTISLIRKITLVSIKERITFNDLFIFCYSIIIICIKLVSK